MLFIVRDDQLVKARVVGQDPDKTKAIRGERVAKFMNYQLLFEQEEWELELDRLLTLLPLVGFICKKTYYDPICKKIRSVICDHKELFIHSDTTSLEQASRISHILHLKLNDFVQASNTHIDDISVFLKDPVDEIVALHCHDTLDKPIDVIEQHCKLDRATIRNTFPILLQ